MRGVLLTDCFRTHAGAYLRSHAAGLGVVVVALLGAAGHELGEHRHAPSDEGDASQHHQPQLPV